jgi:DNA-directed RNA polymerase specialized sigma24 family protein
MADAGQPVDELLLPFLQAADDEASQRVLAHLISRHAEPIIQSITRHKLHAPPERASANPQGLDAEDVHAEILLHLLSRLIDLKKDPRSNPITNFRSYVAVISYNACHKHLRQKYPKRHSLKNRLRYLFTHERVFLIWEGAGSKQYCGMAIWGKEKKPAAAGRVEQLCQDEIMAERIGVSGLEYPSQENLANLANAILKWAGGPVELDDLVNIVADFEGIKEVIVRFDEGEQERRYLNQLVDTRVPIEAELTRRAYLERLWAEIQDLPPRQRVALLFNLRDANGGDCTCLFVLAGVATIRQIAQTLGVSAERLAEQWSDFPLEDADIAQILGVTRQQVINLRKCARERLARRMKAFGEAR